MSVPPVVADPPPAELKPGHRTTEMWVVVFSELGALTAAAAGYLPPRYAALVAAVGSAAYALSRGLAKTAR